MPIYEFSCGECGREVEVFRFMNGEPPRCCDTEMDKIMSLVADYATGTDRSARRRWARDWSPESPHFSTGSLHGARY